MHCSFTLNEWKEQACRQQMDDWLACTSFRVWAELLVVGCCDEQNWLFCKNTSPCGEYKRGADSGPLQ